MSVGLDFGEDAIEDDDEAAFPLEYICQAHGTRVEHIDIVDAEPHSIRTGTWLGRKGRRRQFGAGTGIPPPRSHG